MTTDNISSIQSESIGEEAVIISCIAYAANTPIWAPVVLGATDSNSELPVVATTASAANPLVYGVTVGPLQDSTNGYCNKNAGDMLQVCVFGRCKLKVDGNFDNIAIGDGLVTHAAAGVAQLASIDYSLTYDQATCVAEAQENAAIFAKALAASTVDGDVIPVIVFQSKGTIT